MFVCVWWIWLGLAKVALWLTSGHGVSHQRMKVGKTNSKKDEEGIQRALVDRGRDKSFFWMFI